MTTIEVSTQGHNKFLRRSRFQVFLTAAALALLGGGCAKHSAPIAPTSAVPGSKIQVSAAPDGTVIDTPSAEFVITPTGYVTAALLSGNRKLSLDDAGSDSGIQLTSGGSSCRMRPSTPHTRKSRIPMDDSAPKANASR